MERILLIEDDQALGRGIALALAGEGREIRVAATLAQGRAALGEEEYALVLLDLNLPDGNGLDFLTALRRTSGVPVLILTANDLESDQVAGLELGADDYMTKPFDTSELLARVRALTRRQGEVVSEELAFGDLSLHLSSHCLRRGDKSVRLGFKEFEVLRLLLQNAKLVTPKDDIIAKVWGLDSEAEDNNVEVYISFLRKKLSFLASQVSIGTVRKVGYFLTTSDEPGSFGGGGMP